MRDGARHIKGLHRGQPAMEARKKGGAYLRQERIVRYKLIDKEKLTYPLGWLCRVMRVSPSAYHACARGKTYVLSRVKVELSEHIKQVFWAHRRRYGSRRIGAELAAQGISVGRFQVR